MRLLLPALLAAALLAPALASATHAPSSQVDEALGWLASLQQADGSIQGKVAASAWAAVAFAHAGGIDPGSVALPGGASLEAYVVQGTKPLGPGVLLLDLERQVLALAASGADPRAAPGFDAVQAIVATFDGQQLRDPAHPLGLNDDIFGLLALKAAGVPDSDPAVAAVRAHVLQHQQPSGAWSYQSFDPAAPDAFPLLFADVDTTAAGIAALLASGSSPSDPAIQRARGFVQLNQGIDGGCGWGPLGAVFSPGQSNADSTSWAIVGLRAMGEDPSGPAWTTPTGQTPVAFLASLQQADGSFAYQPGVASAFPESTTAWAALALSGHGFLG